MVPPSGGGGPLSFSKIPGNPSFRNKAVNAVALVPLLGGGEEASSAASSQSAESFANLWESLRRHGTAAPQEVIEQDELLLVIPNSSLTRPGDWRYNETPLKAFHWQHGCQRLQLFDGRPQESRPAHDRLINQAVTRDWIDVCPSRRTAAVVGVLNLRDCESLADLHRAEEELHQWALRYATPPYEVTAHGRNGERDKPVERLFVFDSFDDACQKIDLSKSKMGNSILAFPPADKEHAIVMDLHLNVVVNDLAVAIFRSLEERIRESDQISRSKGELTANARTSFGKLMTGSAGAESEEPAASATNLSLSNMATLVSPENKLAHKETSPAAGEKAFSQDDQPPPKVKNTRKVAMNSKTAPKFASEPQLMTPMDENWDYPQLSARDVEAIRKRDIGRREKLAADLSLLAGSPLDAYERYLKAAELCKTGTPDPLWYAMALVGCAAAHIAMAEAGGYNVDEYLENNFQLPEDIMALAKKEDDKRSSLASTNKQTLPEVVFALCEEALDIVNRSEMLSCFYAELLLELALYSSESAEGHLRCRWGEGPGSFGGDQGSTPRWELTSVSQLKFGELKTKDDRDMVEINTFNRVKKFCELLHEAVSIGSLDPASRVDVAARSARFCLEGVQASQWKKPNSERIKLHRKAAFFSVVAAETLTAMDAESSTQTPENLWLLCSQLFSRTPNSLEKPGSYAWATLRASVLNSLSFLGSSSVSREAAELLLSLLAEISPKLPKQGTGSEKSSRAPSIKSDTPSKIVSRTLSTGTDSSGALNTSVDSDSAALYVNTEEADSSYSATKFASRIRESFTTMTAASSLLAVEAKWADENVAAPLMLPLFSPSSKVMSLGCVWQSISFQDCSNAQRECIERIMALRKLTSTASSAPHNTTDIYGTDFNTLPLYTASPMTVEDDKGLELLCIKKKTTPKAETGSMATFFNPYAKKSQKTLEIKVAGEEERVMTYQFGNSLAVPVRVSQCRIEFEGDIGDRVKSPTLAFDVPPRASSFTVRFPFTMVPPASEDGRVDTEIFEVKGISLSLHDRSFFLPVAPTPKSKSTTSKDLATPASKYRHQTKKKAEEPVEEKETLKLEVYPCQPNPKIALADSDANIDTETKLEMGLTDGQVIATPLFRLSNYTGPSVGGKIQRLQVSVVGIPGTQECTVYDSEKHESTESADSGDEFLQDLFEQENPPALKVRPVSTKALSLAALNDSENPNACAVAFQLAASNCLGQKIPSEATICLRFKCSGQSTVSSEVQRVREIPIRISYIKGPRIASISLRPDLMKGAAYSDMCKIPMSTTFNEASHVEENKIEAESSAKTRLGLDDGVHICSENVLAILVVVNETREDIVLSRNSGAVGGFDGHPLDDLLLHNNVTSQVPVLIPRLERFDSTAELVDAIIERTTLVWETAKAVKSTGHFARGRISIAAEKLHEIISSTPSLWPSLCVPPCRVDFCVNGNKPSQNFVAIPPGQPIDVSISSEVASWVPSDVRSECTFTFEFFCVFENFKSATDARDHMWCGKVRHSVKGFDKTDAFKHAAKVLLLQRGTYQLSGCVRITRGGPTTETWLAPLAAKIAVDPSLLPPQ